MVPTLQIISFFYFFTTRWTTIKSNSIKTCTLTGMGCFDADRKPTLISINWFWYLFSGSKACSFSVLMYVSQRMLLVWQHCEIVSCSTHSGSCTSVNTSCKDVLAASNAVVNINTVTNFVRSLTKKHFLLYLLIINSTVKNHMYTATTSHIDAEQNIHYSELGILTMVKSSDLECDK